MPTPARPTPSTAPPLPRLRTHAVLVGTASYLHLQPVPHAVAGVTALHDALTGPDGRFARGTVHLAVDPHGRGDVLRLFPLPAPGQPRPDVLLFCFIGHGVKDESGSLCLALPGTVDDGHQRDAGSLPVEEVLRTMRGTGALHRIAVLDCCFAQRAADAPAAADVHLLTACAREQRAWAPPGRPHTRFTGALLDLLTHGVPDAGPGLDLATLFRQLAVTLAPLESEPPPPGILGPGGPTPWQRTVGTSGDLELARNPAYGTATTATGLGRRANHALRTARAGREGLPVRQRPERLATAVRLFAGLVADATAARTATDPLTLRLRHAHASTVGDAGDPAGAHTLLTALVRDWETLPAQVAPEGLAAARASRDHWRTRALPVQPSAPVPGDGRCGPDGAEAATMGP